jgi:hypothetical protein
MLAIAINEKIDDTSPGLQCSTTANEEIFLVENLQNLNLDLLDE